MHFSILSFLRLACLVAPVAAFAQNATPPVVQWGASAGVNQYKEPGLMQLQGPEMGLHVRAYHLPRMPQVQLEADALFGVQQYTSSKTGSMNGVHNIETRWRAMHPVFTHKQQGLYAGLGIHTLWNDLRGSSTTGSGGYERSATQLWLPVRWTAHFWDVEAGVLAFGRHTSKLSQANTTPPKADVVNTQRQGVYVQGQLHLQMDARHALSPYVRYTGLGDSDVVDHAYEPASKRWQLGVIWQFSPH